MLQPLPYGVAPAGHAPEAERRQLTVLFCDLVDSTGISHRLDAEDYRELVMAYQQAVSAVIERYEGHVAQYLGDGLLVYFGHPQAHEDDAERAVRCGYDILQAVARISQVPPLQVRVGIHTGAAVVGQIGVGARHETLALGDTSNLAARLQALAEPGMVLISEATLRLVRGLVVTRDCGLQPIKGFDTPLQVYQVIQPSGVRTRLEAAERLTPFVGREAEVALLDVRWQQVCAGEGQAVLISAEPGLGKSRLLLAVHERMRDSAHSWLECRASPMTRHSAYQPFAELLQQGLHLREGDSAQLRLQQLEHALETLGFDKAEQVPLLAPLLNLPLPARYAPSPYGPELKRSKTVDYLIDWLFALARLQPLVLVLEDLHWADAASLELLGRLLQRLPGARILVLMTARREFRPDWPRGGHLSGIELSPLPPQQVASMLDSLTQHRLLPEVVARQIQERAGGVPLFVEEVTKQLLESGQLVEQDGRLELGGDLDRFTIPATLQDSLMARLDRLDEAKALAQLCAVIGREVPYGLLARVAELPEPQLQAQLQRLTAAELLYRRGKPPKASYQFKHALIRDTAYGSLLKSTRQRLHGRIAEVMEQHFAESARAAPAVLAEHYEKGGAIEAAVRHYQAAGEAAALRSATAEAIPLFEKALSLLPALPEGPARNRLELSLLTQLIPWIATARGYAQASVRAALDRARGLLADTDDPLLQVIVLGFLHISYQFGGQFELAVQWAEQTVELGRRLRMPILARLGHAAASLSYWQLGQVDDALRRADQALQIGALAGDAAWTRLAGVDTLANTLFYRAWIRCLQGYPDDASDLVEAALARAESLDVPMATCIVLTYAEPYLRRMLRQPQLLLQASERAASGCERYGYTDGRLWVMSNTGIALGMLGRYDEGLSLLREAIAERLSHGTVVSLPWDYLDMATICLAAGRLDEARMALEQAVTMRTRYNERVFEAEHHRMRGELLLAEGADPAEADACFRRALAAACEHRLRLLELRAAGSLARLWRGSGKAAAARALLQPIYDSFTEGQDTPDLREVRDLLATLQG